MIVGLTGGIGSGKSTVAQYFRSLNVEVIDSDQITRQLVAKGCPAYHEILKHFGETMLQNDGSINRSKLRFIIFESPEERIWLEGLLHPMVKTEILKIKENIPKGKYCVVEIPLLIEANFHDAVDRILVVDCNESTQVERVKLRDALPQSIMEEILKSQTDRAKRLTYADDVIENEGTREDLKARVQTLANYYNELSNIEMSN